MPAWPQALAQDGAGGTLCVGALQPGADVLGAGSTAGSNTIGAESDHGVVPAPVLIAPSRPTKAADPVASACLPCLPLQNDALADAWHAAACVAGGGGCRCGRGEGKRQRAVHPVPLCAHAGSHAPAAAATGGGGGGATAGGEGAGLRGGWPEPVAPVFPALLPAAGVAIGGGLFVVLLWILYFVFLPLFRPFLPPPLMVCQEHVIPSHRHSRMSTGRPIIPGPFGGIKAESQEKSPPATACCCCCPSSGSGGCRGEGGAGGRQFASILEVLDRTCCHCL